jgi:hypothetical protein
VAWIITKYFLTAAVVVLVSELAKRSDRLGGFVAALPLVTVLALIWLFIEKQTRFTVNRSTCGHGRNNRGKLDLSALSCNSLATEVETNQHGLLPSFERAQRLLEEGRFKNTEPGPYRIFAVYSTQWPRQTV